MVYFPRWKVILVLLVCLLSVLYVLPNFLKTEQVQWLEQNLPSWAPVSTVKLGLDLQGGSHILLEVATDEVIRDRLNNLIDQTRSELRQNKIGYTDLGNNNNAKEPGFGFTLRDPSQKDKALEVARALDPDLSVAADGARVVVTMTPQKIAKRKLQALDQSIEIVRRRIDATGTREPSIQRQGDDRIVVQLPGIDNPERIKNLIGQTAKLTFRLVDEASTDSANSTPNFVPPPGTEVMPSAEQPGRVYVLQRQVMVGGETLVDSQPSFQEGMPVVSFRFDGLGGKRFADATSKNVGRLFAIVLDGKVISAPVIREPILGGSGVISGRFTTQEAQDLALLLRAGALPAPLQVLEERTVGPGLGADSIAAGEFAALAGLVGVAIFIVITYGPLFGAFAVVALFLCLAMIFAIMSILGATLTLPGIAGIVLTIGTAIDVNVLTYERMREEQRNGRTAIAAIDAGYNKAMSAIIDANATGLIATVLMFSLGDGPIKGFAITFIIGVICSMFTGIVFTRMLVLTWLRRTKPKFLPL